MICLLSVLSFRYRIMHARASPAEFMNATGPLPITAAYVIHKARPAIYSTYLQSEMSFVDFVFQLLIT